MKVYHLMYFEYHYQLPLICHIGTKTMGKTTIISKSTNRGDLLAILSPVCWHWYDEFTLAAFTPDLFGLINTNVWPFSSKAQLI